MAGGDKGNITAIQLDGSGNVEEASGDELYAVDAHLPLGLSERPIGRPSPRLQEPRVQNECLGGDIINSITIHKFEPDDEDPREEVVAVITSNDKSIRMYSLTLGRQVATLDSQFPMNHATISPDSELLLAVGDFNQAYFFERMPAPQDGKWTTSESRAEHWEFMNIMNLHCPKELVTVGYFTTAWSPSGGLCAVGSECGYVSVFDTELIKTPDWNEDSLVEIVEATRPESRAGPGAIRSMMFSPHPWDLLIWAEDRGRVVVADIRAGLKVRQVIKLDSEEPGVQKAQMQDFSPVPRHLDLSRSTQDQDEETSIQSQLHALTQHVENLRQHRMAIDAGADSAVATTQYLELLSDRRRLQQMAATVAEDPNGLTAEERQILDALRTNDNHTSTRDLGRNTPHTTIYSRESRGTYGSSSLRAFTAGLNETPVTGAVPTLQDAEQRSTIIRGYMPGAEESRDPVPSLALLSDFLRERASDPPRAVYQPRRHASVVLSNASAREDADSRAAAVPPYAQTVNNHGSLLEARHAIESQWTRSPSTLSVTNAALPRPYTPPPHITSPSVYSHLHDDSRPSTSDSVTAPLNLSDDRTDSNSPLRRRTPALRAIEAHHQTISQLRQQSSSTNPSTSTSASPTTAYPAAGSLHTGATAVRPTTSSSSASSPSPPATSTSVTMASSSTVPARRPNTLRVSQRDRSHSRVSSRLSDYEAHMRDMSRYTDSQPLSFLQRQSARYDGPDWGAKSAGLAMSSDGGKLWCASEKGILEVDIDLWGRRMWGAEKFA